MDIKISPVNFNGLWEKVVVRKKSNNYPSGHRGYIHYTLYDFIYHPFADETAPEVNDIVKRIMKGRSYYMVDVQEGQNIGTYYQMNRVQVGNTISSEKTKEYLKNGYTKKARGGMSSNKNFWAAMKNDSYSAMDCTELTPENITKIAGKIFDKVS